jgi:hypothetical protein
VILTGILLFCLEEFLDFFTNLAFRDLNIVFGLAVIAHQAKEAIIGDIKLCYFPSQGLQHFKSAAIQPTSWYSLRVTLGTSIL